MEVLADVLSRVRLKCRVLARYEATAPWGLHVARSEHALFYSVSRGAAVLHTGDRRIRLAEGDFLFLLPGSGFELRDEEGSSVVPIERLYALRGGGCGGTLSFGGGGARTTLTLGSAAVGGLSFSPLAQLVPQFLHVSGGSAAWPSAAAGLLSSEMRGQASGYEAVIERLAEFLLLEAIRSHVRDGRASASGWLGALLDPRIGRALSSIHEDPKAGWTVERLAREAGMSRSSFAVRFRTLIGQPPAEYVTRWRMQLASDRLRSGTEAIAQIAADLGYETESAFGKAFKRVVGLTPGALRAA